MRFACLGVVCDMAFPFWESCLLFWKIFILNILLGYFFHFNSLFRFQRPKILFVEDSFFTLFLCFCSKKRSFGNELRNEIFLEKRGRKQLFFWDNTRENCCATAFFPIKNLTYILPQMRQNINAF